MAPEAEYPRKSRWQQQCIARGTWQLQSSREMKPWFLNLNGWSQTWPLFVLLSWCESNSPHVKGDTFSTIFELVGQWRSWDRMAVPRTRAPDLAEVQEEGGVDPADRHVGYSVGANGRPNKNVEARRDVLDEAGSGRLGLQLFVPFLMAGFGTVGAGVVLDRVQVRLCTAHAV